MPGATLPPDQSRSLSGVIQRVERMERKTRPTAGEAAATMVFSYPGVVAASIESPPWYPHRSGYINTVRVSFRATVSGTTTIAIFVDAVQIQQFSITSGKTAVSAAAIPVGVGSYVTVKTMTVTGADSDMSVQVSM